MTGRKKDQVKSIRINFMMYLKPGQDDDLIDMFRNCPIMKRAKMVKKALRSVYQETAKLEDPYKIEDPY